RSRLRDYLDFIPDPEAYAAHLERPLPPYLRLNPLKGDPGATLGLLEAAGVKLAPVPGVPGFHRAAYPGPLGATDAHQLGLVYVQALTSAMPVLALDPRPGELVLDLCAAPGGKTTHAAQLMADTGAIVANDRKMGRLSALTANLKRMGVTCAAVTCYRGDAFPPGARFDRVLLDAPCSGEGKYRVGREGALLAARRGRTDLPAIQKGLIVKAFDLVRPGGVLVYATCTLNPDENEAVLQYLYKRRKAEPVPWQPPLPSGPGLERFKGASYDPRCRYARRFYPHQVDSVGFFVAKVARPG
ncbi:RsmB/NOP family class I SAM-dependent RNA methyltransferase, partial [Dissulfurirhabdus thermomarina]